MLSGTGRVRLPCTQVEDDDEEEEEAQAGEETAKAENEEAGDADEKG